MAPTTEFDAEAVRASAKVIGAIMDDMAAFEALKAQWPNCGTFVTAEWLERVVDDRRNAVVNHAERLRIILDDLHVGLTQIADDLEDTDEDNAAQIKAGLADLQKKTESDIGALDRGTEAEQHNFTADPDAPEDINTEGDGWNDVLPGGTAA